MALARPAAPWPLLLRGPMLRRVTRDSVAVFIATSKPCLVSLEIYSGTNTSAKGTIDRSIRVETRKAGDKLHVALVRVPSVLAPDTIYGYDTGLSLDGGASYQGLEDLGLLSAPLSLGYDFKLPAFSVPVDLSQLVITYGSCRKAHGPGTDALALLDRIIERDHATAGKRPHHLVLGAGYTETITPPWGQALVFAARASGPGPLR